MEKFSLALKFFVIFNFLIVSIFYFSGAAFAQPGIKFKEIYYDFGEIKTDKQVTHFFEFKNSGNAILTITGVRSTCGCITTDLTGKNLKPGQEEKIGVSFSPKYIEGIQEKNVFVHSNDPDFPIIKLTVLAEVKVAAMVEPQMLYFSDQNPNSKKINLKNKLTKNLTITAIETEKNFIDYKILNTGQTIPATISPDQDVAILVSVKHGNYKAVSAGLIIHTDYIDHPDFKVIINYKASTNDL